MRPSTITSLILLLAACPGAGAPASPAHEPALAESRRGEVHAAPERVLSSLSATELDATCEEVSSLYESGLSDALRARQDCLQRVTWISFKPDGKLDIQSCDARLERCLQGETFAEPGPSDRMLTFPMLSCSAQMREKLSACSARVVDFEACFGALATLVSEVGFKTCNTIASGFDVGTSPMPPPVPSVCEPLQAQCDFRF